MAVDLVVVIGGASADLEAARVKKGGGRAAVAGAAGEGIQHLTEAERLVTRGFCENAEDLHTGACVFPLDPSDPVIGLVVVLELLAEGDCLGTCKAAKGGDA